jgi:hypothetical protein
MMVGKEIIAIQPKISQKIAIVSSHDTQMSAEEPFHFLFMTPKRDVEVCQQLSTVHIGYNQAVFDDCWTLYCHLFFSTVNIFNIQTDSDGGRKPYLHLYCSGSNMFIFSIQLGSF